MSQFTALSETSQPGSFPQAQSRSLLQLRWDSKIHQYWRGVEGGSTQTAGRIERGRRQSPCRSGTVIPATLCYSAWMFFKSKCHLLQVYCVPGTSVCPYCLTQMLLCLAFTGAHLWDWSSSLLTRCLTQRYQFQHQKKNRVHPSWVSASLQYIKQRGNKCPYGHFPSQIFQSSGNVTPQNQDCMYHSCHYLMWNTDKNLYPERALASLEMVAHGEYIDIVKCHIAVSFFLSFEYFSQAQEVGKGCALVPESSQNDQGARESASISQRSSWNFWVISEKDNVICRV